MGHKKTHNYKYLLIATICIFISTVLSAQQTSVTGIVSSDKGKHIYGVSVTAKNITTNKSYMSLTDTAGEFNIDSVRTNGTYSFLFSCVGYKSKTLSGYKLVDGKTTNLLVTLEEDSSALSDVVITGYQNIDRKRFSGSAVKLSAADVNVDGQVDISRMLQGKAAGVSVQNVSGTFGSAPRIRIRGATSLTGDNKPLWVVDGIVLEDIIPISNDQLSSGDPSTLLGSSVAGLNANDIESFEILKDAAATALYGGRAMNGVIVVTTKKGKVGRLSINYSGNFSTSLKPSYRNYDIMNSVQQMSAYSELQAKGWLNPADVINRSSWGVYGKMFQQINSYDSTTKQFALENTPVAMDDYLRKNAESNTNWFDLLFNNQLVQEHNINFITGSEKSQTFASLSYYGDNGWTIADKVKRLTFNINNNFTPNKKLTINFSTRGSWRDQRAPGAYSRKSNPVNGEYDRDFDINPFSYSLNTSRALLPDEFYHMNYAPFNEMYELQHNYIKLNVLDVAIQGGITYTINNDFTYNFLGAARMVQTSTESIYDEYSNVAQAYRANYNLLVQKDNNYLYKDPDHPNDLAQVVLPQGGFYNRGENMLKTYNIRNQLQYAHTFNSVHNVNVLLGQEVRSSDRSEFKSTGPGFQYDKGGIPFIDYRIYKMFIENNEFPYNLTPTWDRNASFYINAQYSYENKYNLDAVFRYDGGNKLGHTNTARWLPTGSISASWNINQESFMKNVKLINELKLRASYGLVGSLGKATNAAAIYRSQTSIRPYDYEKESELIIESLANNNLTWEKKNTYDIGLDGSVFNRRLRFTMDYYYYKSFNLIDDIKTSGIGGQYTKVANNGELTGKGFEVSLNGDLIAKKDIMWTLGFNVGTNYNKITKTNVLPDIWDLIVPEGGNFVGHPVSSLFSINFQGLDGMTGIPTYINENGEKSENVYFQASQFTDKDGKSVPIDKILVYNGPVVPPISGGLSNNFRWKNFSFNFFISFQQGNKIRLAPFFKNIYSDLDAFPKEFDNRWVQPGDEAKTNIPSIMDVLYQLRHGTHNPYNSYNYSTERVVKGDLIRLQTVSLQYNLPQSITNRMKLQSLSLRLTANNVWLIYADKKLNGQDPEFFNSGGVASPINKQYTLSLRVGF